MLRANAIPDFGSLKATARIDDRKGTYGLRNVSLVIGEEKDAALQVSGAVASILKAYKVFVEGIDITVTARNFGLQPFSDLVGHQLSDLGPLNGRFRLTGNPSQLAVTKAKLSTLSSQGLRITATSGVERIRVEDEKPMRGVDISITATAPGMGVLPGVSGRDLPDLGPLQMKASINDRSGSLDVETFEIRSGSGKQALLRSPGQILRIDDLEQIVLKATFETASQPWVTKYMQKPEAVRLYGGIALPFRPLAQRGLGSLWSLIEKDKGAPCILD